MTVDVRVLGNHRSWARMAWADKVHCLHADGRGGGACKHGVPEADIWHAVRNATRRVIMDDDLTMLIGPGLDGSMLEVGVLDIDGEDAVVIHAMALRPKFYRFHG